MKLPKTLEETYARMLEVIDGAYREKAITALQWLVYAYGTLSVEELAQIITIRPAVDSVFEPQERLSDIQDLVRILSGLVTVYSVDYGECLPRLSYKGEIRGHGGDYEGLSPLRVTRRSLGVTLGAETNAAQESLLEMSARNTEPGVYSQVNQNSAVHVTEYDEYQRPVGIIELHGDSIIFTDRPRPRAAIGHKVT